MPFQQIIAAYLSAILSLGILAGCGFILAEALVAVFTHRRRK